MYLAHHEPESRDFFSILNVSRRNPMKAVLLACGTCRVQHWILLLASPFLLQGG